MVVPEPFVAYDPTYLTDWLASLTPSAARSGSSLAREPQVHNLNGMTATSAARAYGRMLGVRAMDSRAHDQIPSAYSISNPVTTTPERPTPAKPTTPPPTTAASPNTVPSPPPPPLDDEAAKQAKLAAEEARRAAGEAGNSQKPTEQQPASAQPAPGTASKETVTPSTPQPQTAPTGPSPGPAATTQAPVAATVPDMPPTPVTATPASQPSTLTSVLLGVHQPTTVQTQYPGHLDPVHFVQSYSQEQRPKDDPLPGAPVQLDVAAAVSLPADFVPHEVPYLTSTTYSAQQLAADQASVQQGRPNWVGPGNPYDAAVARLRAAEYTRYQQLLDLQWSQYRPQNEEEAESWRAAFRRLREGGVPWKDPAVQQWAQIQLQQGILTDPTSPPKWAGPPVNVSPTSPELHPLDKPISAAVTAIVKSTAHSLVVLGDTVVNFSPHAEMRATINARPGGDGKINAPVVPTRPEHTTLEVAIALAEIGSYVVPIGFPSRVAAGTRLVAVGPTRVAAETGAATTRSLPVHAAEATTLRVVPRINTHPPNPTSARPQLLQLPTSERRPNGLVSNLVTYGRGKAAQLDNWGDQPAKSVDLISDMVAKFWNGPPPAFAPSGVRYRGLPFQFAGQGIGRDSQIGPFIAFANRAFGRRSDIPAAAQPKGNPRSRNSDAGSKNDKDFVGPHGTAVNRDSLKTPLTEDKTSGGQIFLVDENGVPHVLTDRWDSLDARDGLNLLNGELKDSGQYLESGSGLKYFFQDDAARVIDGGNINGTVAGSTADLIRVTRKDGLLVSIKTVDVTGTARVGVGASEISHHIATIVGKLPGGKKYQTQNVLFFAGSRAQGMILADIFKTRQEVRIIHPGSGFDSRPTGWP